MAVVDHAPVPRFDALGGPVDPRRARAAPELDPVLGEERFGPQRQAEHVHLAFEKGLRQRRALIGQLRLVGEEHDRLLKSLLAQAGGGLHARMTRANDDC